MVANSRQRLSIYIPLVLVVAAVCLMQTSFFKRIGSVQRLQGAVDVKKQKEKKKPSSQSSAMHVHPRPQHIMFIDTGSDGMESSDETNLEEDISASDEDSPKEEDHELETGATEVVRKDRGVAKQKPSSLSQGSRPFCKREQIIQGKWVPEQLDRPPYVTPTVHLRCYPRDFYYKEDPWETWRWMPNNEEISIEEGCVFTSWNRTAFCELMEGATISIVGDSLSWEHFSSLVQLNGQRTRQGYQHQSRELHMNIQQSVCNGRTRIVYRRDDKLRNLTDSIQSTFPNVLVLNRGAHYVNDTVHLEDIRHNLDEVRAWQRECRETYNMKCHFFWRTSVPGHPECGNFTEPVNDLALMEARVADLSFYNNRSINFHWYDYQPQNELVLKELEQAELDYQVIDAYYLNMLRPDEHRAHQGDCLHNCYPGKMDVYSQLMLQYLLMERTQEDVQRAREVAAEFEWPIDKTTIYDKEATEAARKIREGRSSIR